MSDISPDQYSISRHLFEVYKTDEEHFDEYVPISGETAVEENESEEESSEESETEEDNQGFKLHQGEIMEKYFYIALKEMSWSMDYEDISNSGEVTIPYTELNLNECYLGVRCLLRKDWEKYGVKKDLKTLEEVLLGFVTDQSFSDDMGKIAISGMSKLLERKYEFSFTQMKRSEIIKEVIKTAGLKAEVNPDGLDDQIIDFTNVGSSDDGSDDDTDTSGAVASSVSELAKKICKGKKTDKAKANAIHSWIAKNIPYPSPNYGNYTYSPEQVIKQKWSNCADRSRLAYQLSKVCGKVKCQIVHGPNHLWVQYYLDGKWVDSDPAPSRPNLGVVYNGLKGSVSAYAREGMS